MNVQKCNGVSFGASVAMAAIGDPRKSARVAEYLRGIGDGNFAHKVLSNETGIKVRTSLNMDGKAVPIADYATGVNTSVERMICQLRGAVVAPVLKILKGMEN